MSTIYRLVWVFLVAAIVTACAATDTDLVTCQNDQEKQTYKLKFKLNSDGCVEQVLKDDDTDGNTVTVDRCDTVEWKVKKDTKKKSVAFETADGSPFDWSDSGYKDGTIVGEVKADAAAKSYKYTVRTEGPTDGCPLDPMIIVQP
ncbi:MAG TPA: hypothetical protein VFX69_16890 [Steroidobacteraceae bacterium]|jgi:guanyl-specific ribonuclease Sa|nr:hypothetical protein [Steroidobacteraceae bacterium]